MQSDPKTTITNVRGFSRQELIRRAEVAREIAFERADPKERQAYERIARDFEEACKQL